MTRSAARSPASTATRSRTSHPATGSSSSMQPSPALLSACRDHSDLHWRLVEAVGANLRDDHCEQRDRRRRAAAISTAPRRSPTSATTSTATAAATSRGGTTTARSPTGSARPTAASSATTSIRSATIPTRWHDRGDWRLQRRRPRRRPLAQRATARSPNWLGQANGSFVGNDTNALANACRPAGGRRRRRLQWRRPRRRHLAQRHGDVHEVARAGQRRVRQQRRQRLDRAADQLAGRRHRRLQRRRPRRHPLAPKRRGLHRMARPGQWRLRQQRRQCVPHYIPNSWQVEGTGDFNGDDRDDIVWRRDDGAFTDWLGQANGGFVTNDANAWASAPTTGRSLRPATTMATAATISSGATPTGRSPTGWRRPTAASSAMTSMRRPS